MRGFQFKIKTSPPSVHTGNVYRGSFEIMGFSLERTLNLKIICLSAVLISSRAFNEFAIKNVTNLKIAL